MSEKLLATAKKVIEMEVDAVRSLHSIIDDAFLQAIDLMLQCPARVVLTGMGKAGLIARKVAATLASTGTPSFFMHPAEGVHGDLGMITSQDVVVAFSNAGETEEVLRVIPYLKHFGAPLIAITSNGQSTLAKSAQVALVIPKAPEACPMNLAPTSSTTQMLALGDALALVLLEARGFAQEDYALRHPGGSLGRRLLTKVSDIMHSGEDNPVVSHTSTLKEAIFAMTRSKLAATSVVDDEGKLVGFFTDGDIRRYMMEGTPDLSIEVSGLMTPNPKHAWPNMMAAKALEILREHKIIELPVCDEEGRPIGMVHLHDITRAGIS